MNDGMTPLSNEETHDDVLARWLARERDELAYNVESSLRDSCLHLLAKPGKRLRGRLLLAAAEQGTGVESPEVMRAALAIELLHLASLAHDDVIDAGTMRRGTVTAGVRFGQVSANYAGAWVFSRATELIASCGQVSLELFAKAACEMCEGGMSEVQTLYDTNRTVDDYVSVAEQKTASAYFLATQLGAVLAEVSDDVRACLGDFGREFGLAYQIWDDLADLLAGPERTGKSNESDIGQGIYTLPVIFAIEECPELLDRLAAYNGSAREDDSVLTLIKQTEAIQRSIEFADAHVAIARSRIASLPQPARFRALLESEQVQHLAML